MKVITCLVLPLIGFCGLCFAATQGSSARALSLASVTNWKFNTRAALSSSPAIDGKHIYIGDLEGYLYSIHPDNGKLLWQKQFDQPIRTTPLAHQSGVLVYAGGRLYALNTNGQYRWQTQLDTKHASRALDPWDYSPTPLLLANNMVYVGTTNGSLLGLDLTSGKTVFHCKTGIASPVRNQAITDGQYVYFGNWQGNVFACDLANGNIQWQYDTNNDVNFAWKNSLQSQAVIYKFLLCFNGRHSRFYCLNNKTGQKQFVFASETDQWLMGEIAQDGKLVYFGSSDQKLLFAYNLESATPLWQAPTDGRTWGRAALNKRSIYVANNSLQKFNRKNGALMAEVKLPAFYAQRAFGEYQDIRSSSHSHVISRDNTLFLTLDEGMLLSVKQF